MNKEIKLEKIIYLCKYHDIDLKIAKYIGVTAKQVNEILDDLKENDLYEYYRNLDEFDYEKIIKLEKKNNQKNAYIFKGDKKIMENNNNLTDLNELLFGRLRKLDEAANKSKEELEKELAISKQYVAVSQTIINNANLLLQARKHFDGCGAGNNKVDALPLLGEIKDDK